MGVGPTNDTVGCRALCANGQDMLNAAAAGPRAVVINGGLANDQKNPDFSIHQMF